MQQGSPPIVELADVSKRYDLGPRGVTVLEGLSLSFWRGGFHVILGSSGSGKSTLLNLIGGIDRADSGSIVIDGKDDIAQYTDRQLTKYRRDEIGFVFQFYNLIASLTVLENVCLAPHSSKASGDPRELLSEVGLADHARDFPSRLSGGELQRVSIARALYKNPKLLLCDEPTGALDSTTARTVLILLKRIVVDQGRTLIMVTHNPAIARCADTVTTLKGRAGCDMVQQDVPLSFEDVDL
ncbi:MAG: ABC transporter ATP-binding protein [Propionibacteriaceae bacterium]|jgi:putative ABC transport system ATP-binding protein|nr:ABC transporter ATP-binding protein [Propionibacteriaceae bacterium]